MRNELFIKSMESYTRNTRRLILVSGDPGAIPISKISGAPWWPESRNRPCCQFGHHMAFIAQFRLDDVPDLRTRTPELLSFHYCQECAYEGNMAWGYFAPDRKGFDLSIFTDLKGVSADGLGITTHSVLDPFQIGFSDALEIPSFEEIPSELQPADYPQKADDFDENVYPGLIHVCRAKLGGWPTWVHGPQWPTSMGGTKMGFVGQLGWDICESTAWANGYVYLFVEATESPATAAAMVIQSS